MRHISSEVQSAPVEGLSGLVERVTYHNADTGFAVLKVAVKGRREPLTVIGSAASINAGEWLTAEGRWVRDKEHGLQFRAERMQCTEPSSLEGIEKYLGSGLIKGIGPVYARKLVNRFGDTVFDVIDRYSAKLEEIDGIGPGRRKKIKDAWAEQKVVREIMVFLHSQGVSTSRAVRIYKLYGENAVEKVRDNPYILARDVPGIGFKTADQIAQKLGIPADSVMRARAGVQHVLLAATNEGHCALPRTLLIERSVELLGIQEERVSEAISSLISKGDLVADDVTGMELMFHPAMQLAELGISEAVRRFASRAAAYPPLDEGKALKWCEEKTERKLAAQQTAALRQALRSRIMVITGGPGVGKTTLIHSVLTVLTAKKVRCVLCAPTGRAAKRMAEATGMEARTIHRLLEYKGAGKPGRDEANPIDADLVIVDETSMVDVSLMHRLLRALPDAAHVIFVGDVDQLPSVGPGTVLHDLIESNVIPVVKLTEVFRQAALSNIILAAHAIHEGTVPELGGPDSDFHFLERSSPESIEETVVTLLRERIPRKLGCDPVRDIQVLCPMNRGRLGARALNQVLQAALNPAQAGEESVERFGWVFRLRDKVMQTRNNYDKEVFNGDIGFVVGINLQERELKVRFEQREVLYDFGELDELTPAFAITVHKAQGSEFPVVVIPLAMQHYLLLQRNLIYTAVTRGKRMVVVAGEKKALGLATRRQDYQQRFGGLLARLRCEEI